MKTFLIRVRVCPILDGPQMGNDSSTTVICAVVAGTQYDAAKRAVQHLEANGWRCHSNHESLEITRDALLPGHELRRLFDTAQSLGVACDFGLAE